jgi:hypothetical protein
MVFEYEGKTVLGCEVMMRRKHEVELDVHQKKKEIGVPRLMWIL